MNPTDFLTAIAALGGLAGIGSIVAALVQRGRGKAQSETEARAQNTAEFNAIVAQQNIQINRLESRVNHLEKNEDYIDLLIAGITNGTIPPIPPRL